VVLGSLSLRALGNLARGARFGGSEAAAFT